MSPLLLGMSTSPPLALRDLIICAVIVASPCSTAMCRGVLPVNACTASAVSSAAGTAC